MSPKRPYKAWCYACSERQSFPTETKRATWVADHAATEHADRTDAIDHYIGQWTQGQLDLGAGS